MSYEDFLEQVLQRVKDRLGDKAQVRLMNVRKNNSVCYDALSILAEQENLAPTIYLNSYYDSLIGGESLDSIVDRVLHLYRNNRCPDRVDLDFFASFEKVKPGLVCRVINLDDNEELLKEIPYRSCLDLAIIYCYIVNADSMHQGAMLIRNEQMQMWGVTEQELYEWAMDNTGKVYPPCFISMPELAGEMCGMDLPKDELENCPLYVLTNSTRSHGAIWMTDLETLRRISKELDSGFYILPSSIHECIVVSDSACSDAKVLCQMVVEVNQVHVSPEEVLADTVYYYSRSKDMLSIAARMKVTGQNAVNGGN